MGDVNQNRTPLRELYDNVVQANGWSLRDVERRIKERWGDGMSKSRISQVCNADPLPSISGEAIRALAVGLNVTPERVAVAAVQSMGFRIFSDSISPAEAIKSDETLSEDVRRSLLAILSSAGEGRRGA